jgi:hypothetical protein
LAPAVFGFKKFIYLRNKCIHQITVEQNRRTKTPISRLSFFAAERAPAAKNLQNAPKGPLVAKTCVELVETRSLTCTCGTGAGRVTG